MFKFLLSCLKMLILFQCFLRFACHGDYLLGMPPAPPHLPLGEDHMLHPSPGESGSSGGPSPPLPHSSACLAPLALVAPGCWALGLCGCEQARNNTFKYSHVGWGPLRAKGTESLVLGAQLLVVLGWTVPLGSQERWE